MFSVLIYSSLIFGLVYWIESKTQILPNSLIIKKNPAEDLENWLKRFNWSNRHEMQSVGNLPLYKFYTEIVELLLNIARKMGGSYHESLLFLREGLQEDRQFEKKLREIIFGTYLQMLMMVMLTWGFIFGALQLVEVKISFLKLFLISGWQGIGLSLLPFLLSFYRRKFFGDIGKLWKMLYVLRSLVKIPLARSEVMTIAGVNELKSIKQKSLLHLVDKLKLSCQKALQQGGSYEEDVLSLMGELRFQEKWHFELFEKRLMVVKLGLMSIFFLPSYLAFIFLLFRRPFNSNVEQQAFTE